MNSPVPMSRHVKKIHLKNIAPHLLKNGQQSSLLLIQIFKNLAQITDFCTAAPLAFNMVSAANLSNFSSNFDNHHLVFSSPSQLESKIINISEIKLAQNLSTKNYFFFDHLALTNLRSIFIISQGFK